MIDRRSLFAALAASLVLASAPTLARPAKSAGRSWDGRWAGAWGGKDATAITVSGGHVVSYEYNGQTNPVASSHVTAKRIVYGDNGVVVTLTRTGANTAHAKIKTGQGNGAAELVRR